MQANSVDARRGAAAGTLERHAWPAALAWVLGRLKEGGHGAWIVGGSVRDVLLGRPHAGPFDVATTLLPDAVTERFPRVVPIGIAHGTVLIVADDIEVECTTLREEGVYEDARRPASVRFTRDPVRDLARRDFTVNAMAWDPDARVLLDPFGGLADLGARVLRAVGDPAARFREDVLRPLRLARFTARLGMSPDPATLAAMVAGLPHADGLAAERARAELDLLLTAPRPSAGLEVLRQGGWLEPLLPEVAACIGVPQNRYHAHEVYGHTLATVDAAPAASRIVRWAALLHDIGKPGTRAGEAGEATFHGHERLSAELAARRLDALRYPAADAATIVHLVREHMFEYTAAWSDAAVRRWLRRVGPEHIEALFALRAADSVGAGVPGRGDSLAAFRARIHAVLEAGRILKVRDLPVDGRDIMRILGCGPGPNVGAMLEKLLEAVIEDPRAGTRDALLTRIERLADTPPGAAPRP